MLVNLTPHEIVIDCEDGFDAIRVPPSGQIARLEQNNLLIGAMNIGNTSIPIYTMTFGKITGLPPVNWRDRFIVSRMVLDAVKDDRDDVFAPGEAIRDEKGVIIACKGLSR